MLPPFLKYEAALLLVILPALTSVLWFLQFSPNPMLKRLKSARVEETLDCDVNSDDDEDEDRISDLPDSVLCHILRKIPTKYAVGTALLSTRWKHLFSQIPYLKLNIEDSQLLHPRREDDSDLVNQRRNANFIRFMYNLLTVNLRDVPRIYRLYLELREDYGNHHIEAWISAVVRLNVSELWLFFYHVNDVRVSTGSLFRCTSLVNLVLGQHCFLNVPSSVSLPNLKTLCLFYVTFRNSDTLEKVIAACPVLKALSLIKCKFEDFVNILRISSPSVKDVMLDMVSNCHDGMYDIMLDMPILDSMRYIDYVPETYHIKNLNSVRKAHIDVGPSLEQLKDQEEEDILRYMQNVTDLIGACSNVSSLYLSRVSMVAIYFSGHLIPIFRNLTELELGYTGRLGWELLPHLLEIAPNLEVLVFWGGFSEHEGCYAKFRSRIPDNVLTCLTFHLHKIIFRDFKGEEDELDLVGYFLKHAKVLRKIEFSLSFSLRSEKLVYTRSKLLDLQKSSGNCQMDIAMEINWNDLESLSSAMKDNQNIERGM